MKRITSVILCLITAVVLCLSLCSCNPKNNDGDGQNDNAKTVVSDVSVLGAGGYGAVFNAKIDPYNSNYFGALCDMGSLYFSYNKGESWQRHNIQGTLYCLEYDPTTEGVVWAAGSGVFKSTDHGKTMKRVLPKESEITSAGNNYENANYWIYTDKVSDYAPHYQIWSMAIDRSSDGKNVFVAQRVPASGLGYNKAIRILRTTDGENFSLFGEFEYSYNYTLDFDESNDCLILATDKGIYEINMNGEVEFFLDMPVVVQHSNGNTMSFDSCYDAKTNTNTFVFSTPVEREHIAAACYKTNNLRNKDEFIDLTEKLSGLTTDDLGVDVLNDVNKGLKSYEYCEWINGGVNGKNGYVKQQFKWTISYVSVLSDDVIYLFHEAETDTFGTNSEGEKTFYIKRRTSVYLKYDERNEDKTQFKWVYGFPLKPYNKYIENTTWQDADMGFCFGMTSATDNENALLFSNIVGVYYTADGGKVRQLNSVDHGFDEVTFTSKDGTTTTKNLQRVTTTGTNVICSHKVVIDPYDDQHMLIGSTDIGLVQSYDGGKTWYHSLQEWKNGKLVNINYETYTNTCFDLHFDKERKGVVYAIWSQIQTAPYAAGTKYLNADSRFGISYDGGLSWEMKNITPNGKCLAYRMQVVYNGSERTIYVTTDSNGFFVTKDLGENFTAMNDGLERCPVGDKEAIWGNDLVVCDMGIFAITCGSATVANNGNMFYKWNEKLNKFEQIGLPSAVSEYNDKSYSPSAVRDIAYDEKEKCIYLACTANVVTNYSEIVWAGGGIWKYKDGEFTQIYDDSKTVCYINFDSKGTLYAIEQCGKLIRFNQDYSSEVLLDGLFHRLKSICFGTDDNTIFIPTWGGGTYKVTLTAEK